MRQLFISFLSLFICFSAYSADFYATSAGAGDNSGDSWANAMTEAELETAWEGAANAGDNYWVMQGTYTLDSDIGTARDGSTTAYIEIIGVDSSTTAEPPTSADYAYGTDRPYFVLGDYTLNLDDYWGIKNIRTLSEDHAGMRCDVGCRVENGKFENNAAEADRSALAFLGHYGSGIHIEASSTNGEAIDSTNSGNFRLSYFYVYDSKRGLYPGAQTSYISNGIIDTCTTGIEYSTGDYGTIEGITFYNNTTAVLANDGWGTKIVNNIFDSNTTALSWTTQGDGYIIDYNVWWNNGTDVTNMTKGVNAITTNPQLTNPAAGDFTIGAGSSALDAGAQVGTLTGLSHDYDVNCGADKGGFNATVIYDSTIY